MSTQNGSFIARVIRAIVDAFKAQCVECARREQIRWLSVR
jgi:hypothetical protein